MNKFLRFAFIPTDCNNTMLGAAVHSNFPTPNFLVLTHSLRSFRLQQPRNHFGT